MKVPSLRPLVVVADAVPEDPVPDEVDPDVDPDADPDPEADADEDPLVLEAPADPVVLFVVPEAPVAAGATASREVR